MTFTVSPVTAYALLLLLSVSLVGTARADPLTDLLAPEAASEETAEAGGEADGGTIAAESSPAADVEIRRRLLGIYAELDALDGLEASVASGIVTLRGRADSARGAERAVEIASQVEGVVEVVDEISVDTNVARRLGATVARLQADALSVLSALPVLLLALAIVVLFGWLGGRLARRDALFRRLAPNGFIAELLGGVARIAVLLLGLFLALSLLDATSIIGTVLGAAGIVGLAVGFAVRDTVENWIASVLLSLRTPFLVRDYVAIGEHEGAVARLTSRATVLISFDGNHIRIPNATVYKSVIVNYSSNPERRFEFTVGVDTDLDLNEAQATALEAVHEVPGVLDTPGASVIVEALGDSNVTLTVMAWIDQRSNDVRKVRGESIRFVKQAFDVAGIVMPEPIYRVNLNATPRAAMWTGGGTEGDGTAAEKGGGTGHGESGHGGTARGGRAERDRVATDVGTSDPSRRAGADGEGGAAKDGGEPSRVASATPQGARLSARDARDTSLDAGVEATLDREIGASDGENLLAEDARRE